MRLLFFCAPSPRAFRKAFEPECAIVPRFRVSSSRVIPIPKSWIVMRFALSSVVTLISGSSFSSWTSRSVIRVCRSFSRASEAFEISSRTKISFSV